MKILKFLLPIIIIALTLPLSPQVLANPGVVIDDLVFDAGTCNNSDIIHISGDVYAIAYGGVDDHGWVKTFTVDSAGNIGAAVIDSLEWDTVRGINPRIIHVAGNVYTTVSSGPDADGWAYTFTIETNGQIGAAVIDTLEFDGADCDYPTIIYISGTVYAVAYEGVEFDGWVCTFDIETNGQIGAATIDTLEWDTDRGLPKAEMLHVSGNVYAVTYSGGSTDGWTCTFEILANGQIGAAVIDTLEWNNSFADDMTFLHISGTTYVVAYRASSSDGTISTFAIENNGQIGAGIIDTLEFTTNKGYYPTIIHSTGDVYVIAYVGPDWDGWARTYTIETNGTINGAVIDTVEYNDDMAQMRQSLIKVGDGIFAVGYTAPGGIGQVTSFDIEAESPSLEPDLFIVYSLDKDDANLRQVYVKKSTDDGASWGNEVKVSWDSSLQGEIQYLPGIATDSNGKLWVAWTGRGAGGSLYKILVAYSDDGGATWSEEYLVSSLGSMWDRTQADPDICITSDNYVHVVWRGDTGIQYIYYTFYNGSSWSTPEIVNQGLGAKAQGEPTIDSDTDDHLHVAWEGRSDAIPSYPQIYYAEKTGVGWPNATRISDAAGMGPSRSQQEADISVSPYDESIHVVWDGKDDTHNTNDQIWHNKYTDSWGGPTRISTKAGMTSNTQSRSTVRATNEGTVHAYWYGKADGDAVVKIYHNQDSGGGWGAPADEGYVLGAYWPMPRGSYLPVGNRVINDDDLGYSYQYDSDLYSNIDGTTVMVVDAPSLTFASSHRIVRPGEPEGEEEPPTYIPRHSGSVGSPIMF